jgi:hypothetical protein
MVRYLTALTSATRTNGFTVLAFRRVRRISALRKPERRNSFRRASPSLAPAIHANQLAVFCCSGGNAADRISSAE